MYIVSLSFFVVTIGGLTTRIVSIRVMVSVREIKVGIWLVRFPVWKAAQTNSIKITNLKNPFAFIFLVNAVGNLYGCT